MAIFGLYVEDTKELNRYIRDINEKLQESNLFTNPYKGLVKKYKDNDKSFIFVYLQLIWINTTYPALLTTVVWLYFYGLKLNFLFYISIGLWFGGFLFSNTFTKLAVRFALKKKGYTGIIKNMSDEKLLLSFVNIK